MTLAALGFAPSTADPSLFLRTNTLLPLFYVLVYVNSLIFATADTEALALVKSELPKRHTSTDLGELRMYLGLQITRDRARCTITLTQSHMVHQVLQRFNFPYSSPLSTPLPTGHSLSAPPSDESVEPSGLYLEFLGCLMYLMTCTRPDLAYPLSILAHYVDNKAMIALCQEHRVEHRTKHIAPRYFLAGELQQRGQLRLAYVATRANTADTFNKALQSAGALLPARRLAGSHTAARTALPALPCCCPLCCAPPCWPTPCCLRAALLPTRGPVDSRTALPCPACFSSARVPPCLRAALLVTLHPALPAMDSLRVLTFDHEGHPIQFDTWLDDLQLYLLSDSRDSVSLFDLTFGASLAPPATADSATRSQWLTLARYSSPATAGLGRLILPYLFPELSAFATVEDLVTHLRTSEARYRTALPAEWCLYFIVTRHLDSLRTVRDYFLALDPTDLTVDLLEKHLLAAETSVVAVGAAHGTPRTPFFEGCSPSPLAPPTLLLLLLTSLVLRTSRLLLLLVGSAAAARAREARVVEVAAGVMVVEAVEVAEVAVGLVVGVGASVASVVAEVGVVVAVVAAVGVVAAAVVAVGVELSRGECGASRGSVRPMPPDPGIEAAALGASESALPGTAPAEALHTFTLDSGASRCFFRDSTTLTPLPAPVPVRLADPSGGPVLARSTTALPCLAVPSGSLSGLHLPSFSTNLVSTAGLRDAIVTTTTPGVQRVSICTCTRTGRHLAKFTRWPRSSLYTLTTEPPQVAASAQHHRRGHPSLPRLRGMHSRLLVSRLPRSLPALLPSPAPPCLPCVEGRQRAAPHSSSFPPTTTPLQTLHMDVWGPARVSGQGRERYFLLVVDNYSHYTTVFPLRSKGEVPEVLIPWIRAVRLQLRERFREDLPVLRPHLNRGVMEVARTSMIHASVPHFLWPFAVRYAAHQVNLWPRVSLPETSPTLRWTGKVCDASVFRVWGSRAFFRDTSADKLSSCAIPCVFLGFPPEARGWQFYHPTSRRVFPSQDVTFDESVPFYRVFPYRTAPPPPPAALSCYWSPSGRPPPPSCLSQVDPLPGTVPVEVAVDSGAARGATSRGTASGGAELARAEPGGAEPEGAEPGGAESEGAESEGAEPRAAGAGGSTAGGMGAGGAGATSLGGAGFTAGAGGTRGAGAAGPGGALTRGTRSAGTVGVGGAGAGDPGAGGTCTGGAGAGGARAGDPGAGDTGAGGAGAGGTGTGGAGAGGSGAGDSEAGGTGAGGARAGGSGARDPGVGGAGAGGACAGGAGAAGPEGALARGTRAAGAGGVGGAGAGDPGAGGTGAGGAGASGTGAGGTVQRRPFFVPPPPSSPSPPELVLRQVLSLSSSTGLPPSLQSPPPFQSQPQLQPDSPLPALSLYAEQTDSFTERREPESRPASPVRVVRTGRRVPHPRPPPVPSTHVRALRPSSIPLRVPLPPPPASSLPEVRYPKSDLVRAASPTVPRLLATVLTDPSFESAVASALVTELVDYPTSLVAKHEDFEGLATAAPHLVATLLAPEEDLDAPDIPTPRSYAKAITGPYSSQWQTAMDAKMAFWKSTCTYVDAVPPSGVNIVDGMWIFRMKRPPGSPPVFKARYVAGGFNQRQGVDFFHNFSPTPKMTTLWVLLHVAAQRDYELHSLYFSTAFLQGSLHEEIWLRRPPGFTGSFLAGTQWSLRRPVYGLCHAPRKWHDTLRLTLAALGFAPSTAGPTLLLRTDTSLPPFYFLVYVNELVFATVDTEALALVMSELQKRHTCTDLAPPSDDFVEPSGLHPELVGCLMYLMTSTRPDLAYPLSILARYVAPGRHRPEHWEAAKRVLRYLCSTSGMGLVLGGRGSVVLTGHADASWVDDLATQQSSQGYDFSLGSDSVSWRSTC
ncbi:unnamed protein product [Closterium sp. NIES-54]